PEGAMAADSPVESLREEATCPLCLEYFTAPVTLECGHNFCQACISQCWEGPGPAASCPQCRETVQQGPLRPNRQLANIVEIAKRLSLQAPKGAGGDGVCGEHQEVLKLFCDEDQSLICVICHLSQAHHAHRVLPVQEAAQEYQEHKFGKLLVTVKMKHDRGATVAQGSPVSVGLASLSCDGEGKVLPASWACPHSLPHPKSLTFYNEARLELAYASCTNKISSLPTAYWCWYPVVSGTATSSKKRNQRFPCQLRGCSGAMLNPSSRILPTPIAVPSLCQGLVPLGRQTSWAVTKALRQPNPSQVSAMPGTLIFFSLSLSAENVTLDPDTAHPQLVLSEDGKRVSWGVTRQDLPDNPERFNSRACVLGQEGFTSGRHYWEVEVGDKRGWVTRKGWIMRTPEEGIWAVDYDWSSHYRALTSPRTSLPLSEVLRKLGVYLDCDRGQVTFSNADKEAPIFTFPTVSFHG
uniref:Tripartite motif containing 39 n=1 Tax=Pelodiscus sinensis TaxID=13735 RepID=K7G7I6_PELSI